MSLKKIHLVQISNKLLGRQVALVEEPLLISLKEVQSIYELSLKAIDEGIDIVALIESLLSDKVHDYSLIYEGKSDWSLLPAFDCPKNQFACLVSGTGLTHRNSALNRQMMHQSSEDKLTDSLKLYQWGIAGGKPKSDEIGSQPEWFFKGNGTSLKAHGQALIVPPFAEDGGEEPEVVGVYVVDKLGKPWRIGFCNGNEFSDHKIEKRNYLYLASSKLRDCSIGPELIISDNFDEFSGSVSISRKNRLIWSENISSGEKNMSHNLPNLEYHHFKYDSNRIPLQAHVHFFGADAFSFGKGIQLEDGDMMSVEWQKLGRALKNPLRISNNKEVLKLPNSIFETIANPR